MRVGGSKRYLLASFLGVLACFSGGAPAESLLKPNDVVAIVGDSITEQKQYSVFIENYLRMCQPTKVNVVQFGWGGETAGGFRLRLKDDCLPFKPTLVTTCYGMNDGGYHAIDDPTRERYRVCMTDIVTQFQAAGTRVIVGSPGIVDSTMYKRAPGADGYNAALAALRDEAKTIAEQKGAAFADVHSPMRLVDQAGKERFGANYHVGGNDGVHPGANGHLVMAYAFLKAMNLDGEIGAIRVDLSANTASGSEGHEILKSENGALSVRSTRYPFCFTGKSGDPQATVDVPSFLPFNSELNRYTLTVTGMPASVKKYRVSWGAASKEYDADQLRAGVNLAADFVSNPFSEPFARVEKKIREKQQFETRHIKGVIHAIGDARAQLGDDPSFDAAVGAVLKKHAELNAAVAASVEPVVHTIVIEAITAP